MMRREDRVGEGIKMDSLQYTAVVSGGDEDSGGDQKRIR
jgi:hypothetical protein